MEQQLVARMREFGTTIFAEMSALALRTGAVNLGQGFPDTDGPAEMLDAAVTALRSGRNQYAPGPGIPELRAAIADHQRDWYGLDYDADREVLVTAGATEAIAATILALCEAGDEVLCFEPYYDSYAASIALAGAVRVPFTLHADDFSGDTSAAIDEWSTRVGPRARLLLLNSPHNPTGKVFTRAELEAIARLCLTHNLIAVTDEVYEHLVFEGSHIPLATLPGMRERTVTISSAGKTFNCTGWKIGWVCSTPALVDAVTKVKQFLTFTNAAPLQPAVAVALRLPRSYFTGLAADLAAKRDLLCAGLAEAGFDVHRPAGTYFVTAGISAFTEPRSGADAAGGGPSGAGGAGIGTAGGGPEGAGAAGVGRAGAGLAGAAAAADGLAFCRSLPERCGVVAVPVQVFYDDVEAGRSLVRFAFCKRDDVLAEAVKRLHDLR